METCKGTPSSTPTLRAIHACAVLLLCGFLAWGASAFADEGSGAATPASSGGQPTLAVARPDTKLDFNIPAQDLNSAILAFAQQTGIQVFYDTSKIRGLTSSRVIGQYTSQQALDALLADTGISYRFGEEWDRVSLERVSEMSREIQLKDITVTARQGGVQTSISAIPESITIIDAKKIQEQAAVSPEINDLLGKTVPGLTLDPESNFDLLQIRGRSALVLINGVPQNTLLREVGINLQTVDINAIERIEVIRGASATYGFGAQGGIVNIITKRSDSEEPEFTSRARTRFSATHPDHSFSNTFYQSVGGKTGDLDYLANFSFEDRGYSFDATGKRTPNFGFQNEYFNGGASLGYQFTEEQSARVNFNYFRQDPEQEISSVNGVFGRHRADVYVLNDDELVFPVEDGFRDNLNLSAQYTHDDILSSQLNLTYFHQAFRDRRPQNGLGSTDTRNGLRINAVTPVGLIPDLSMNWGVDLLRYENNEKCYGARGGLGFFCGTSDQVFVPQIVQDSIAVYGQWDLPVSDFNFTFGVRHEEFFVDIDDAQNRTLFPGVPFQGGEVEYSSTLFNAGVVYHINEEINVFAGFNQGFDVSQMGRATFQAPSVASLDPQPATTDQYEIGLRVSHDWGRVEISGFYSESDLAATLIQLNPNEPFINLRQPQEIWGVELAVNSNPIGDWTFGGTGTYQDGDVRTPGGVMAIGSEFIAVPRITAYTQYTPFSWWTNRFQVLYTFDRKPFDPADTTFGNGNVNDFFTADLITGFTTPYGNIEFAVENLFNTLYFAPSQAQARNSDFSYYAAQGTNITVGYTLKW
ncbi:MAG: TonB-dependent receptor [Nitrospina sp.]|nr:TonB-dependent receptor [Nitrospina sp.]